MALKTDTDGFSFFCGARPRRERKRAMLEEVEIRPAGKERDSEPKSGGVQALSEEEAQALDALEDGAAWQGFKHVDGWREQYDPPPSEAELERRAWAVSKVIELLRPRLATKCETLALEAVAVLFEAGEEDLGKQGQKDAARLLNAFKAMVLTYRYDDESSASRKDRMDLFRRTAASQVVGSVRAIVDKVQQDEDRLAQLAEGLKDTERIAKEVQQNPSVVDLVVESLCERILRVVDAHREKAMAMLRRHPLFQVANDTLDGNLDKGVQSAQELAFLVAQAKLGAGIEQIKAVLRSGISSVVLEVARAGEVAAQADLGAVAFDPDTIEAAKSELLARVADLHRDMRSAVTLIVDGVCRLVDGLVQESLVGDDDPGDGAASENP